MSTAELLKLLDENLDEKFEQKLTPHSNTITQLKEKKVEKAMEHIQFMNAKFDEINETISTISQENKFLKTIVSTLEPSCDLSPWN